MLRRLRSQSFGDEYVPSSPSLPRAEALDLTKTALTMDKGKGPAETTVEGEIGEVATPALREIFARLHQVGSISKYLALIEELGKRLLLQGNRSHFKEASMEDFYLKALRSSLKNVTMWQYAMEGYRQMHGEYNEKCISLSLVKDKIAAHGMLIE